MSELKHYVDEKGNVYGYSSDGSQDCLIGTKKLIEESEVEVYYAKRQEQFNAYIAKHGHPPASLDDY
jgi:hypothetical protein